MPDSDLASGVTRFCSVLLVTRACAQSCPVLGDPVNGSPAGSFALGIFQARIVEWVAMSSSRGSSDPGIKFESPALAGGHFLHLI